MTSSIANHSENVRKLVCRQGPFSHPDFEPSLQTLDFIRDTCKILVLGAGGLGCEILKNLAMMGFWQLHVIDMDTIDLSNLNRQFLFRQTDIGKPKAEVAASFLNNRISGCNITPHYCRLEDRNQQFYRQFHLIISGLDSIPARRWMNTMLISLLKYDSDDNLDYETIIPFIDGGTEGFKGNSRVIIPGMSACFECTIDLYPPQINYPLCTIANTPRLPEHCIEYARLILWSKENPFECNLDTDDPSHLHWIYDKAYDYAGQHGIQGVTYSLTQGVTKNIIPAVASTNAAIAALLCSEAFKIATNCYTPLNNYMIFNDLEGIYTYEYEAERKPDCLACGRNVTRTIEFENDRSTTLKQLLARLTDDHDFQLKSPGLMAQIDGTHRTLYLNGMAGQFAENLTKSLHDLGLRNSSEISVLDATVPNSITIRLRFSEDAIDDY